MSKAFMRESDDAPEQPLVPRRPSPLPPGTINYVTPQGMEKMHTELAQLPSADERARYLRESLQTAVVVPQPSELVDQVRFGATVTVRDAEGESTYRIVGVDEAEIDRGWISWLAPLAKALLNARAGDRIQFRDAQLQVVRVAYE